MEYSIEQRKAIDYCIDLKRRVVAITGQAGTGKTTIMKEAVSILRSQKRKVAIAAPTGRAARRIFEATGIKAVTIHKLLEYGRPVVDEDTGLPVTASSPSRHSGNRLEQSDILVDEYMMVNEELHRNLMDALPPGARLIAFGDVNQLPPIEEWDITDGNGRLMEVPFERLLKLPSSVTLDIVFRQAEESGVLFNARRIRLGSPPIQRPDFIIKVSEVPIKDLRDIVVKAKEQGIDYSSLEYQVISPARRGQLGTHTLNQVLQTIFKSSFSIDTIDLPRDKWAEKYPVRIGRGEKIICNENLYDLRDFFERYSRWNGAIPDWSSYIPCPEQFMILNGEIGIVEDIFPDGTLSIQLPDRLVRVPSQYNDYVARYNKVYLRDPRKKFDLAYAVTTHKMQGSECEQVIFVMHRVLTWGLNRNNLYTAITRAKKGVVLITDQRSLLNTPKYTAAQKAENANKAKTDSMKVGDI